ncbi:MAG: Hsp20/alpha crystallin family protein [Gemmatimonadaceae bacterium]
MRTEEKRGDAPSARPESQSPQAQQSAAAPDVARPVPSASEPGSVRSSRTALSPFRGGVFGNPWELMRNMSDEIDRLIDSIGGTRPVAPFGPTRAPRSSAFDFGGLTPTAWTPQIEVVQKPNALVLRADLPGLKPEDVTVSMENGMLTISGERKQEQEEEREGFFRSERSYGSFYRAFPLPDGVEEDRVAATFKNGVLEISLPTTGRQAAKKIKIQS